jgi:hypothetical protein
MSANKQRANIATQVRSWASGACRQPVGSALCVRELRSSFIWYAEGVKVTRYFEAIRTRPDRAIIRGEWIERAIRTPFRESVQFARRTLAGR